MADALDDFAATRVKTQKFLQAINVGMGGVSMLVQAKQVLTPLVQEMNADPDIPQNVRDAAMAKIVTLRQAAADAIS